MNVMIMVQILFNTMKLVIIVVFVVSTLADEPISLFYHQNVGIDAAARIKLAEEAVDFDGGSRITGGWIAALGVHPHAGGVVISLTSGATSVCGCSLLSNTRAITTANCWWDGSHQAQQFVVVLGSVSLFYGGTRIVTSSVDSHGSFNPGNLQNNIAMINFGAITLNNNIQPALLPFEHSNNDFVGAESWIAGFGREGDGSMSDAQISMSSTTPKYRFEGIDYYELPETIKDRNTDCESYHNICIRNEIYPQRVCVYNIKSYYYDDYYSICQARLTNCVERRKEKRDKYGSGIGYYHTKDRHLVYFNGEGYNCNHYLRMGIDMDDAYWGDNPVKHFIREQRTRRNILMQINPRYINYNALNIP